MARCDHTTGGEIVLSHDDPMYLQSSDHPGMNLVSIQLNGNNFLPWKRAVLIALGAKNKLDFVNDTLSPPQDPDDYNKWKKTLGYHKSKVWRVKCVVAIQFAEGDRQH
ncbi:Unknown protein [Striga hermonthica]|uniref:Retrotransposon Copia-like N-terminal domain-containing protein n=1 Tax=Striga hermonthica TaxID=68872 RepID=A0A9N7N078_STRHE|nr:Unknown protein [Striga hermonthica]